jgi:N-acylglucosamine 2-epimerase
MEQERIDELIGVYRDGLLEDTLPFWTEYGPDRACGGFFTGLDRDGTVIDTDKGVWQQCRAAWLFGELYNNVEPRTEWLDLARLGIEFIDRHGFDPDDGRMWFHLTREGRPIRKRRYAFSESFAAVAYGELARATGEERYAEKARGCFHEFLEHHSRPGRMEPKFTGARPRKGLAFPMIAIVTAQELRDSVGLESAEGWIDRCIETIEQDHVKPSIRCVMETVGPEGEIIDHFDARTLNPGHAIEGACFIMEEGRRREDDHLVELGTQMLDYMWERGWDQEHGGILYFRDVYDRPVQEYWQDMKFWWPQNETITAALLAHLLTGEKKYARWHRQIHDYALQHFADPQHGEWFGYLHRDGSLSVPLKGNLWKGPFHLPRMQLRCWQMLRSFHTFLV